MSRFLILLGDDVSSLPVVLFLILNAMLCLFRSGGGGGSSSTKKGMV